VAEHNLRKTMHLYQYRNRFILAPDYSIVTVTTHQHMFIVHISLLSKTGRIHMPQQCLSG